MERISVKKPLTSALYKSIKIARKKFMKINSLALVETKKEAE